jgi:hypothetical protein
MTARHVAFFVSRLLCLLSFGLAACAGPVALYHDTEGGAIAQPRQPPPGENAPYPNLADVPHAYDPAAPGAQAAIAAQARGAVPDVSPADPAALAGLELPTAAPPLPPGIAIPTPPPLPDNLPKPPPAPPTRLHGPAVVLGFAPHKALLPYADDRKLADLVAHRGDARVIAGGFGDGTSLPLAIERARRVAAALTARGVPARDIRLVASAAGSGGFVQLVY